MKNVYDNWGLSIPKPKPLTSIIYAGVGGEYDIDRKMDDLKLLYRAYVTDSLSGGLMEKNKVIEFLLSIFLFNLLMVGLNSLEFQWTSANPFLKAVVTFAEALGQNFVLNYSYWQKYHHSWRKILMQYSECSFFISH